MKATSQKKLAPAMEMRNGKASDQEKNVDILKLFAGLVTPTEDHIRQLAEAYYCERIERGEAGTPEDDWYRAELFFTTIE